MASSGGNSGYVPSHQARGVLLDDVLGRKYLDETQDLQHKATGWMLREVWKRDTSVAENFLRKHYESVPRTTLRYAIERMPEERRQRFLKGTC